MKINLRACDGKKFHYLGDSPWSILMDPTSGRKAVRIEDMGNEPIVSIQRWTKNSTDTGEKVYPQQRDDPFHNPT